MVTTEDQAGFRMHIETRTPTPLRFPSKTHRTEATTYLLPELCAVRDVIFGHVSNAPEPYNKFLWAFLSAAKICKTRALSTTREYIQEIFSSFWGFWVDGYIVKTWSHFSSVSLKGLFLGSWDWIDGILSPKSHEETSSNDWLGK